MEDGGLLREDDSYSHSLAIGLPSVHLPTILRASCLSYENPRESSCLKARTVHTFTVHVSFCLPPSLCDVDPSSRFTVCLDGGVTSRTRPLRTETRRRKIKDYGGRLVSFDLVT